MAEDEIQQRLIDFIRDRFLDGDPRGELEERTPLLEWGVLNSLNTAALLSFVRNELGVTIPPARITARDLKNVRAIAAMVRDISVGAAN
jgi:acyl carrier protein